MNRIAIIAFCALSLVATLACCALIFPYASMTQAQAQAAQEPADLDSFGLFDLGADYGELTIFDLVGHYMDNPPQPESAGAPVKKKHFGGC